jgi:hypothetical protein
MSAILQPNGRVRIANVTYPSEQDWFKAHKADD